jgi:hypothetical protein
MPYAPQGVKEFDNDDDNCPACLQYFDLKINKPYMIAIKATTMFLNLWAVAQMWVTKLF